MKKSIAFLTILTIMICLSSCSEATIEEDALKAAQLTMQSDQYTMDQDYKNASRLYTETQEIVNKYKNLDRFDEFYFIYNLNLESMLKTKYGYIEEYTTLNNTPKDTQ